MRREERGDLAIDVWRDGVRDLNDVALEGWREGGCEGGGVLREAIEGLLEDGRELIIEPSWRASGGGGGKGGE